MRKAQAVAQPGQASDVASADLLPTALPPGWEQLWQDPDPIPFSWSRLRRASRVLAEALPQRPTTRATFGSLVGSEDLHDEPIHRWFFYKEGFSPHLLSSVIDALELGDGLCVADPFGGVATTCLAGQADPRVAEVRSVEYSPFARFVGQVKTGWYRLRPDRLQDLLPAALDYSLDRTAAFPELAAFHDARIFHPSTVASLVSAREHVASLAGARRAERAFFLLGLAAVVEDLSGAMKDGRALRIKGSRRRRPSSLADSSALVSARGRVKSALAGQWSAMMEDLISLSDRREGAMATPTYHLRGDARSLHRVRLGRGPAFPDEWADLSCFSPPYLNCLDYTELYKLELWLMGYIKNQEQFRRTRRGTLRSHPSVRFKPRPYFVGEAGKDIDLATDISSWIREHGSRREVGPVVREYFEDMLQVWREQCRLLKPSGVAVCVVANSTFALRRRDQTRQRVEHWRLPVLTDVLLGHLALRAGFKQVEIWPARDLRPRNARAGRARESLVVARRA